MKSSSEKSSEAQAVNSQLQVSSASSADKDSVVNENTDSTDRQHLVQKRHLEASEFGDEESQTAKKTKPTEAEDPAQRKEKTNVVENHRSTAPLPTSSTTQDIESISLAAGLARVKYETVYKGSASDFVREHNIQDVYYKTTSELAEALQLLELSGAAPVAEDGKLAGNVAARVVKDGLDILLVSKSGKQSASVSTDDDFCIVTEFDPVQWSVTFYANDSSTLPTSDTPLHHAAFHAAEEFHWDEVPYVSLHGHALETADKAEKLGLPCSTKETLFSTPDDMFELVSLLKQYPFPLNKIFVRKGHGFLVLGKTTAESVETFRASVMPFIA